ncbi:MAG TPA: winged helix-turn-helix domain-containing protein [Candidatus Blautia excrementipullorum]|nr:winged helix-turn-helix domain-containing protein [Candidatus Blautia excrementipullorum]
MKEKNTMEPIYTITGTVVHGRGIGKHVGTPTANIESDKYAALPETGVYVAKILLNNQIYYGVTHVGMRPTLDNDKTISIETHIFHFNSDIYGCIITIHLYKKLREVRKFKELSLLIEQVANDRLSAQKFWGLKQTDGTLYIDVKRHCVMIGKQEVYLSANEFEVFYMLYLSPQTTFTKEQIYEKIWHEPANDHLHAVENTIFQIRKK